jgi:hypothetical protein
MVKAASAHHAFDAEKRRTARNIQEGEMQQKLVSSQEKMVTNFLLFQADGAVRQRELKVLLRVVEN